MPMSSYESRLSSLQSFVPLTISKKELASCMFHGESSTSCLCELCKKNLDSWDSHDIPSQEHFNHQPNCPIFNLNTLEAREKTFPPSFIDCKNLIKQGFFFYRLKEKSQFDLFCFRCGFYVSENMNLENENIKSHFKVCRKTKRNGKFNFENKFSLFYVDLALGKYSTQFDFFCRKNVHIPDELKDGFREAIASDCGSCLFDSTFDIIKRRNYIIYKECEKILSDEIQNVLEGIDRKFEEAVKKILNDENQPNKC
ncbi:Baculoviral IAP repeat-containing protein 5 [Conglomerata obtusa]